MNGNDSQSLNGDDSKKNMGTVEEENKQQKKTSKFLRNRLGDMSKAEVSNPGKDNRGPCPIEDKKNRNNELGIWPNLVGKSSNSTQLSKLPASGSSQNLPKVEDIQSANKDVVGKIRAALESEEVYLAFKLVSADYRKDLITTEEYLAYVHQFSLSYLVPDLARLCRDPRKEKELLETYNFNVRGLAFQHAQSKKKSSRKGKEKCDVLINHKAFGNGESIKFDCIHIGKDGSILLDDEVSKKDMGTVGGGFKPRKKTPMFLRNHLGGMPTAGVSGHGNDDHGSPFEDKKKTKTVNPLKECWFMEFGEMGEVGNLQPWHKQA